MTPLGESIAVLAVILVGIGVMLTGLRAGWGFSPRLAGMRMLTPTGGNAASVIAAVSVAQLVVDVASDPRLAAQPASAVFIPVIALAMIVGLVTTRRLAEFVVAVVGIAAGLFSATATNGIAGALVVIAVAAPLIWLLGLVRGLFGS